MESLTWRKASLSSDNGEMCVEVAVVEDGDALK
jgi:hypothetical protein